MEFTTAFVGREKDIATLFETTFTASEGAEEGARIGRLAADLMAGTPADDLVVITYLEGFELAGAIMFSRLAYEGDPRRVFLLAPVAVAPHQQGRGVGRSMIDWGLENMRRRGADIIMTYGDPAYYSKTGFSAVSETDFAPPRPLSQPHGWLGQSLTAAPLTPLSGVSRCVAALDDPAYW